MVHPLNFTFERYIGQKGYSQTEVWDFHDNKPLPGFIELGVVDAIKIPIRPRTDMKAVMLEDIETHERFWLHVIDYGK